MKKNKRNLVFISHATPEDNTFVMWLSTRLKLLGYVVWSDVTQLFGGEKWWDEIEEVIDASTAKFVLVITKTSLSKPGVIRELENALQAENKHDIKRFIIPIIIDDSPFGGQPYDLSDRNIISFSANWAKGLANLKERFERDNVPLKGGNQSLGEVLVAISHTGQQLQGETDVAVNNELKIEHFPKILNFFRLPGKPEDWKKLFSTCPYPWFQWSGMLVSFAEKETLQRFLPAHISLSSQPSLDLKAVLEHDPHNHTDFAVRAVINQVNYLIGQAWNQHMADLGLFQFKMANGYLAWYFPDDEEWRGKLPFSDLYGVIRKKQIIGFSPKNKLYWHYAVEVRPQFGHKPKIQLIPHVIFTEDGVKPVLDHAKMHRMRRRFCSNWWNPRWRDLLLGYLNQVAKKQELINVAIGGEIFFSVDARPMLIETDYVLTGNRVDMDAEDVYVDLNSEEGGDDD